MSPIHRALPPKAVLGPALTPGEVSGNSSVLSARFTGLL